MYQYTFPYIEDLAAFQAQLTDDTAYRAVIKDGYVSYNYNGLNPDNFPEIKSESDKFIRECRGIAFDLETGKCIARPFHKFFNHTERPETMEVDMLVEHAFFEKLDGSMVFPLFLSHGIRLATKAGITDTSMLAETFITQNDDHIRYWDFIEECQMHHVTPIFEFIGRENRIVIDYEKTELVLLAARDIVTGEYIDIHTDNDPIQFAIHNCGIKLNKKLFNQSEDQTSLENMVKKIRAFDDKEGVVITFHNGHRMKIKAEQYVKLHRFIDISRSFRKLLEAFYSEEWDDIYSNMDQVLKMKVNRTLDEYRILKTLWEDNLYDMLSTRPHFEKDFEGERPRDQKKDFAMSILKNPDFTTLECKIGFNVFDGQDENERFKILQMQTHKMVANASKKVDRFEDIVNEVLCGRDLTEMLR